MPIKVPNALPAAHILESENIFVMDADRAYSQDIRPLKIILFIPFKIPKPIEPVPVISLTITEK